MSAITNRKVVLNQRPQGEIQGWQPGIQADPVQRLRDGKSDQTLAVTGPYMRPTAMNDQQGLYGPIEIGAPIVGESLGRVVEVQGASMRG